MLEPRTQETKGLVETLQKAVRAKKRAFRESKTLLSQTVYLGSLGLMLVTPTIVGAYLGQYLDQRLQGFSFSWTVCLILLGVFVGAYSVYLFIKENEDRE